MTGNPTLSEMTAASAGYNYLDDLPDELAHFGVKGMRWGVHKDHVGTSRLDGNPEIVRTVPVTRRGEKNPTGEQAHKTALATFAIGQGLIKKVQDPDGEVAKLNREWHESGKAKDPSQRNNYDARLAKALTKEANQFTSFGTGAKVYVVRKKAGNGEIHMTVSKQAAARFGYKRGLKQREDVEIVHSDEDPTVLVFEAVFDEDGLVVDMARQDDLEHTAMTFADADAVLMHYGIKGMRWGIRRTDAQLGANRLKKDDGSDAGGSVRGTDKEARERLKKMPAGSALVVDLDDGSAPKILVKQKDGSFKETRISADAERLVKTTNKDPHEMSDREIKEANSRAQAVEQYNKLFNPLQDPNAELKARVEAMQLQKTYSQLRAEMNPSRTTRAVRLINSVAPAFKTFQQADKVLGGQLSKNMNERLSKLLEGVDGSKLPKDTTKVKAPKEKAKKKVKTGGGPQVVYNISDVGRQNDPSNPFIPALGSRNS